MAVGSHKAMNRGRAYGWMLLLDFVAALLGVMVLHKLRERRILNLLLKEKDHQLISLQLLLQKEEEYNNEMKNKNEEMKAEMYTLSTQKMELDRRFLEMQSTIDSLKDEQKTLESAMEEMKNEIKMRREAEMASAKEISQLTVLTESLKQKEAEIQDLKHRAGFPIQVPVNLTDSVNMAEKDKSDLSSRKDEDRELNKYTNIRDDENSTSFEDGNEKKLGANNISEMTLEQLPKVEISQEEDDGKHGGVVRESVDKGGSEVGKQINITNSMKAIVDAHENVSKLGDKNSDEQDSDESEITEDMVLGKAQNSEDKSQEVQLNSKGLKKLEILDSRIDVGSRLRRKHGRVSRTRGKRWRMIARSRGPEYNSQLPSMSRRFHRLGRDGFKSKTEGQISIDGIGKGEKRAADENPQEVKKALDSEYPENRDARADPQKSQLVQENETFKSHNSPDMKLQRNTPPDDESTKISSYAKTQELDEFRQPEEEEEASSTERKMSSRNNREEENDIGKEVKDDNKSEMTDETEAVDTQEKEAESTDGDSVRESNSNLEEDKEVYKEETEDSEF